MWRVPGMDVAAGGLIMRGLLLLLSLVECALYPCRLSVVAQGMRLINRLMCDCDHQHTSTQGLSCTRHRAV
jgi:hypothetical protein